MERKDSIENSTNFLQAQNPSDLTEFDPLVSIKNDVRKRPRVPSRPPPPPPNLSKENKQRSHTVSFMSNLSTDMVSLNVDDQPIAGQSKSNANNDKTSNKSTPEQGKSTFVSYVSEPQPHNNKKDTDVSTIGISQSQASSFGEYPTYDSATNHNEIASKLLGQRDELMQLFMAKRQDDYTSRKPFRLFAGTWNVNGQLPPDFISEWTGCDEFPPDVYVVGFQELDLSKEAFVFSESSREDEWVKVVSQSLHPKSRYKLIKLIRLVGMMLLVYVAEQHEPCITRIVSYQVGTGLLGKMGNKGGVAVRFNIHSSTVCVVNSHLAAHAEMVQRRNEDFSDICSRMRFFDPDEQSHLSVFQHDVLIWIGDLNYRIDGLLPEDVKAFVDNGHYKLLKENDQLNCQRRDGNVFQEFEEGEINFRPTYKYNPGTDMWDTSEKCRTPAWCDRVLWREAALHTNVQKKKPVKAMTLQSYRSHQTLTISDHKPVSALFDMDVKVIDNDRYRKVYEEEIRRLDRMENDWLPTMTLSQHAVEFGEVKFQQALLQTIELHNTGQTPCHFEFIKKLEEASFCKPWLTISKPKGFIMPGEKLDMDFEVYVNRTTASNLNSGVEKIEDILVLHLQGGKDFFVTVNGHYHPSCFGTSIEALCRMKKPIRKIPQSRIFELSKIAPLDWNNTSITEPTLQVPKELWKLLDHLYNNARQQADLFQQPGLHFELQQIQEDLDTTVPSTNSVNLLPGSNHSVAESLLVFLEALPEPVIPFDYYQPCLDVHNDLERSQELVLTLSTCHRCVFNYLIAFLQELPKYECDNGLNTHHIATIFSGIILRPTQRKPGIDARIDRQKATTFIENFLVESLKY